MPKNARVAFIFITILLDAVGLGLMIPVMPDVLRRFVADETLVSEYFGYFIGCYSVMQFVASPVLGSLSDKFGRKPILLSSLFGAGVDYLFMAFAPTLPLLFVGRVISGLTGASATVASSYMADISDDTNRSANFGMIGAGWGIGFIVGPIIGGLLGSKGPSAPFIAAAVCNLLNFVFGLFVLPESLPKENRREIKIAALNPFSTIVRILRPSAFVTLIWIYFLIFLAGQVHPVNWTLYTETKFHWSQLEVGISLSVVGVIIAISQGLLTRMIIPRLGEERSMTLGLAIYATAFTLFGLATHSWMMYAVLVYFGVAGVTMPALQSILGRHVPANRQGELQGSLVSLGSASTIIAPVIYTFLFVTFTKDKSLYFPGAAYVCAGTICAFALGVWAKKQPRQ